MADHALLRRVASLRRAVAATRAEYERVTGDTRALRIWSEARRADRRGADGACPVCGGRTGARGTCGTCRVSPTELVAQAHNVIARQASWRASATD